jgi:hypothetical protein
MEDLERYLDEIVDPIIKEFEEHADSRRMRSSRASLSFMRLITWHILGVRED